MPKNNQTQQQTRSSTRARTQTQRFDPTKLNPPAPKQANKPRHGSGGFSITATKNKLTNHRKNAAHKEAIVKVDSSGTVDIKLGAFSARATQELYNYAFLVNGYIKKQRGRKIKVKKSSNHHLQQEQCRAIRAQNQSFISALDGPNARKKTKAVVAHVPDQFLFVKEGNLNFNQVCDTGMGGIGSAPGWMPMEQQANGVVAQIFGKCNGAKQSEVKSITINGEEPEGLLSIDAYTKANNNNDPFGAQSDEDEDVDVEEDEDEDEE